MMVTHLSLICFTSIYNKAPAIGLLGPTFGNTVDQINGPHFDKLPELMNFNMEVDGFKGLLPHTVDILRSCGIYLCTD